MQLNIGRLFNAFQRRFGDLQQNRQQHATTAHCLFDHDAQAQHGIDRRTPRSKVELGVRLIGERLAEVLMRA